MNPLLEDKVYGNKKLKIFEKKFNLYFDYELSILITHTIKQHQF